MSEIMGKLQSLIITSNQAPSDWYPLLPNPVVAESLLDRLINTSHQVIMNGDLEGHLTAGGFRSALQR
ncbi:ATP-binding protein [Streptomyces sp. NPDC087859]|uniref:ATP-binding protein n=1 Tax=Streptomyces sp. NPDC087859 TaxID=3365812 RepID=UPI0038246339